MTILSFAAEVIADSSGKWVGNGLMRWFAVRDTRVVGSADPVNTPAGREVA